MAIIFETIHGSHLYGLAHQGSDLDWYQVVDYLRKPKQTIKDGVDTTIIGFKDFINQVYRGVPQACEALFSQRKMNVNENYKPMLDGIRVCGYDAFDRYERTIHAFNKGDFKKRRHGQRLILNLAELRVCGRFNPTLNDKEIMGINES